jgi:hypothetical protein
MIAPPAITRIAKTQNKERRMIRKLAPSGNGENSV